MPTTIDPHRNLGPGKNTSLSYDAVGNAEDLSDVLICLQPERAKFLAQFGRQPEALNTHYEWFTERLRPPQDNAHLEKEDYKFQEIDSQEGLRNYIQHFQNTGYMTDTMRRVKRAYGTRSGEEEFARAVTNAMKGQSDDIEFMIVTSRAGHAETPASVPARSGGIPFFLNANTLAATVETTGGVVTLTDVSETQPVDLKTGDFVYFTADTMPTGLEANKCYYIRIEDTAKELKNKFTIYPDLESAVLKDTTKQITFTDEGTNLKVIRRNVVSLGGTEDFTLDHLSHVRQMIYMRGGNGNQAFMSLRNKKRFSELVNAKMTANRDGNKSIAYNDVATVYESDFGTITAHGHMMYSNDRIDILDMQYWDLKWMAPTHEVPDLAKTGNYETFVVESDLGVYAAAPQASGAVVDIKR